MLCEYGCGQEAQFVVRNTHNCCSSVIPKCSAIREKNRISATGKIKSKETREKISKSRIGKPTRPINPLSPKRIKKVFLEKHGAKCQECGWDKRHPLTNHRLVQFHHLDGNDKNTSEENLRLLCPNCHSLTDGFMFYGRSHKRVAGEMVSQSPPNRLFGVQSLGVSQR